MKNNKEQEIAQMRDLLANQLAQYVQIIREEYKDIIPAEVTEYLDSIKDFRDVVKIEQTGTITCYVQNGVMHFPLNAFEILNVMKKTPGFGIVKNHKTYTNDTIINNDNTYIDYMKHVFLVGLTPLQFYQEMMLHETMHLCGIGDVGALREGIAELKTRELAQKYGLITSACGYPKEVQIAYSLQNLLGKDTVDRMAFAGSDFEIAHLINKTHGENATNFCMNVSNEMQRNFDQYYFKEYPGITGPIQKTREYSKINYMNVYGMINNYSQAQMNVHQNVQPTENNVRRAV